MSLERVEEWVRGFAERRLSDLDEPRGSRPGARRKGRDPGPDDEAEA